jgi:hypothetical protein
MDVVLPDIPEVALSNSSQPSAYPKWFLLEKSGGIPVALRTDDVGPEAFDCMKQSHRIMVVPRAAEIVADTFDDFFMSHPAEASLLIQTFWEVCNPDLPELDHDNAFEVCLLSLVADFMRQQLRGSPPARIDFLNKVSTVITGYKDIGSFERHGFAALGSLVLAWCEDHRQFYESESDSD